MGGRVLINEMLMSKLGKGFIQRLSTQDVIRSRVALAVLFALLAHASVASSVQTISVRDPSLPPAAGGGGDSGLAIVSSDGGYLLFASTANNVALTSNTNAIPSLVPPSINVF